MVFRFIMLAVMTLHVLFFYGKFSVCSYAGYQSCNEHSSINCHLQESLSLSVDEMVGLSPGAIPSQASGETRCNGGMS